MKKPTKNSEKFFKEKLTKDDLLRVKGGDTEDPPSVPPPPPPPNR